MVRYCCFLYQLKLKQVQSINVMLNLLTKGTAEVSEACDPVCKAQHLVSEVIRIDPETSSG
ncbi:MAG: hypothetical protein PHC64_03785 [Candidatus Gastranaerophilales bacterium]|nr:hypothetical protein [Candidatus Gastranaerophilales bacterium]